MTEVYNILNLPQTNDYMFVLGIFGAVGGVIFLILLINLIKMITSRNVFMKKIVMNALSMIFLVVWITIVIFSISSEEQAYGDYCEALESGAYSVESGEPVRLNFYPCDNGEEQITYNICFWINDKYFDSGKGYGSNLTENDIDFIQNNEIFEVKYIVDDDEDNIILSLSVGEKTN